MGDKRFVTFKRLLYPMSCEEVKSCFRAFVESVCEALHELHSDGNAHLDILLENICFCPEVSFLYVGLGFPGLGPALFHSHQMRICTQRQRSELHMSNANLTGWSSPQIVVKSLYIGECHT